MHVALFQPDIPQNTGTIIRMCACLDTGVHIIEPCGFPFSDRGLRRAGMDYADQALITRHADWDDFQSWRENAGGRLILLSTRAETGYTALEYRPDDVLLLGRESAGVPDFVHDAAKCRVRVPMKTGMRSLNVAVAAAMVLGEALRQTTDFGADFIFQETPTR